jgi:hypothetical protein
MILWIPGIKFVVVDFPANIIQYNIDNPKQKRNSLRILLFIPISSWSFAVIFPLSLIIIIIVASFVPLLWWRRPSAFFPTIIVEIVSIGSSIVVSRIIESPSVIVIVVVTVVGVGASLFL